MNSLKSITCCSILYFSFSLFCGLLAQDKIPVDKVTILQLDQKLNAQSQLGGVVVDQLGYIYVANFRDAVWKISPDGKVVLLTDGCYGSSGNAIDSKGNLYQANFLGNTIIQIDRFGNISTFIEEDLNGPVGMVFDKMNNLYVCNFKDNNILKITPQKQISIFSEGDQFNGPNGITIDNENQLYVANFNSNLIVKISQEGASSEFATIKGTDGNAHLVFYNDHLYVTKIKSNLVHQVNMAGEYKLLAGTGKTDITQGEALKAAFSAPNGIGVNTQMSILYVNNVNGQWTSKQPSTIDISQIKLSTLSDILSFYMDNNDPEDAKKALVEYRNDPFRKNENVGPVLGGLGWQYMAKRNIPVAITIFDLLAETYPERWLPLFYLGDVYKIIGQTDKAKIYYEKALIIKPDNPTVKQRLESLKKGP